MTVAAPPHPPERTDCPDHVVAALIEEAKQRARRRRRTYGTIALVVAIAAVAATVAINGSDTTHSEQSGPDTSAGAVASATAAELVASMHLWHAVVGHGDVWLYLYADGRLISREWAWVERRLTPEAVARVQDEIISTGLFDPDRRPPGGQGPAGADLQARNGDRLVNLSRAEGQTWTPDFDRLAGRLATLQSWLPETAWAQPEATPYVPDRYAICTYVHGDGADFDAPQPREPADLLPRLPASAAALLATASHVSLSEMTREIDPAAHERFDGSTLCFDVTSEQAARLAASLASVDSSPDEYRAVGHIVNDSELPPGSNDVFLFVDAPPSETIHVVFHPILPHGASGCPCAA